MNITFDNKRVLVTGAASGIGKGIALRLAENGASVLALDISQDNLNSLTSENASITAIAADLTDWKSTQDVLKAHFPVDMLVNCAGLVEVQPVTEVTEEKYERLFNANVKGTISITQAVVGDLLARGVPGSVVTISSQASKAGLLNHTIYAASKGALDSFTRTLALELGPKNIRVNCVNPTVVMTPLGRQAWSDPTARYGMLAKIPLQRFAEVDDVVDAVIFLLSDRASMITGHCLPVDGGFLSC